MKKVIRTFEEDVRRVQDYDSKKIYAFKNMQNIYKLTNFDGNYFFDYVLDTESRAHDYQGSDPIEVLKEYTKYQTVYEFDSPEEFARWLVKETK